METEYLVLAVAESVSRALREVEFPTTDTQLEVTIQSDGQVVRIDVHTPNQDPKISMTSYLRLE